MSRTPSIPDLQDLEPFFRGRVPGDPDRWVAVWGAWAEDAEERRCGCLTEPEEWPADVEKITRGLRAGMSAGRKVKPTGATRRRLGEGFGSTELAAHELARAFAMAEHAGGDSAVQAFRERWLSDGVRTTDDEVLLWASEHAGPVSVAWVNERGEREGERENVDLAKDVGSLLAGLVRRLAGAYGWEPSLAATFVLTGGVPDAPMLRVRTQVRHGGMTGTASDLITLRVHPDVPVGEVEAAYRTAQAKHYGRRAHLIGDRTAEAVCLSTTVHGGPKAQNVAMREPYADAGNFRRTVERAKARLMGNPAPVTRAAWRRALLGSLKA